MSTSIPCHVVALCAALLYPVASIATEVAAPPGAEAAALETKADAMQSNVDKACRKVAPAARALCHEQYAQAVERLRAQAARKR